MICGDSAQHVDGARALLSEDETPNFGFRKPGYTLLLAELGRLTGNMSWSAVVANHVFARHVTVGSLRPGVQPARTRCRVDSSQGNRTFNPRG